MEGNEMPGIGKKTRGWRGQEPFPIGYGKKARLERPKQRRGN
jgi:hypothetical protein